MSIVAGRCISVLLGLALSAAVAPAFAQSGGNPTVGTPAVSPAASLSWLVGSWRGGGAMMGNASEATLNVRPALGGRFLELSYQAGQFEGRAFYRRADDGSWQAQWFDNRGDTFPIAARARGRELTADWGPENNRRGRTLYRLADDGRLHVTDSVRRPDGNYREFASHILTRAE